MTTEYPGSGDPQRSMELLWGTAPDRPRRGPKPRFSVPEIVRAAVEIADAEGLAALSMRRVAERLGTTAMSLYTYVPSKAELLDVMIDTVWGELAMPAEVEGGWRARLELVARENWALSRRHPWLLQVGTSRPVLGPNLVAKYDYELRAVDGIGLTDVEMDLVVGLVLSYVNGAVRGAVDHSRAEQETGMTDDQWWAAWGPQLEKVLTPDPYPTAARVGTASAMEYGGAVDPGRMFEFGLQRMLDGIEAFLGSRRP